jgi:type II secretory pathway pseudopilin PulG
MIDNAKRTRLFMKKAAFTMLELVFVIVVAGILAAVFIPRFERDNAGEAAYQIARHIRLAQHHALVEDKFEGATSDWNKKMWAIIFRKNNYCYSVFSNLDKSATFADLNESAVDPLSKKRLFADTACSESSAGADDVLLWKSFGVDNITMTNCGTDLPTLTENNEILFDHLGRPYQNVGVPLAANCVITIQTNNGHSAQVTVYKGTGFVKVTSIDGINVP